MTELHPRHNSGGHADDRECGGSDLRDRSLDRLEQQLRRVGPGAVAVSGGVDSMTLAVVAHRLRPDSVEVFHAVSPAVPPEGTERVRRYADREGWALRLIDAGEFDDENYLNNPTRRCYYCKTNLYGAIAAQTSLTVMSGTNLDDLGDFRPGLLAAEQHGVIHPYVNSEIDKNAVRQVATVLGLTDLAALPAAPCLASRVQTGIPIAADSLGKVNRTEQELTELLNPKTIRCRVRHDGIAIELDEATLVSLSAALRAQVRERVTAAWPNQTVHFTSYKQGSAFLQ